MRPELSTRSCCDDFCTACCCAVMCAPASLLSIPFHLVANILCTIAAPCEDSCRVCGATRHEIDSGRALFQRARDNPYYEYYGRKTYHIIDGACREDACSTPPCAATLFACCGMKDTLREKIRGGYGLDENTRLEKLRTSKEYVSIQ